MWIDVLNKAVVIVHQGAMTDTQSGPQEPAAANDDPQARFFKSLITVFKDNRDVLPSLPEMMEQCLENKPRNPNLAEEEYTNRY